MVRFKIVLDKRTKKRDGTFPLSLRVYYGNSGGRYIPLNTFYTEQQYKSIFEGTPNPVSLEHRKSANLILERALEINKTLPEFDFKKFKDLFTGEKKFINPNSDLIKDLYDAVIERKIKDEESVKTIATYKTSRNSILLFKSDAKITDITPEFLQEYEKWFVNRNKGKLTSTISIYLRCLRAIINELKSKNKLPPNYQYPFGRYAYNIPEGELYKYKKTLSVEEIQSVINFNDFESRDQQMARDIWLFQFYCNGINFLDLCLLKWSDRKGDIFQIKRSKTKKSNKVKGVYVNIPIIPPMIKLLEKIGDKNSPYVLGFLKEGMNQKQIRDKRDDVANKVNKHLQFIKQKLNLSTELKTKTTRYEYATTLKRNNFSLQMISEMLGQSSPACTKRYLNSFEDKQLHQINSCLPS